MTSKSANEVVDLCSPENSDDDDDDAIYDLCSDAEPELDDEPELVYNPGWQPSAAFDAGWSRAAWPIRPRIRRATTR